MNTLALCMVGEAGVGLLDLCLLSRGESGGMGDLGLGGMEEGWTGPVTRGLGRCGR